MHTCYNKKGLLNKPAANIFTGILFFLLLFPVHSLFAQQVDILLKGGHVIDPKNKIDAAMDIAISGGKILQVASNIPATNAKKVIDVTGMYVTPALSICMCMFLMALSRCLYS
jgi:dihydroorotase